MIFVLIWQLTDVCQIDAQTRKRGELIEQELKLRHELENDSSFKIIPCRSSNNEIRLSLYDAANFSSKKETVKAKMICGTIEGDPIPSYLTVNQGKITCVVDASRDKFGSMRLYSKECESLTLGTYITVKDDKDSRREFKPIQNSEKDKMKDKVSFVLRCENKRKDELRDADF